LTTHRSRTHAARGAASRLLRAAAYALLLLYATYLVAANMLLNTPIGQRLANPKPEKTQVGWDRALTIIPAHVQVWNLRVAGNVRRTVWSVQAEHASGRIALLPLLSKTISVRDLVGQRVSGGASLIANPRPAAEARPCSPATATPRAAFARPCAVDRSRSSRPGSSCVTRCSGATAAPC
jgi:hypothetical protein